MNQKQIRAAVEAMLFAAADPISADKLAQAVQLPQASVEAALEDLRTRYQREDSGLCLLHLDTRWQLSTKAEWADCIRRLLDARRAVPLGPAAMETLTVIAYNQPVSRAFIEQVRGVDSSSSVTSLLEKGLIEVAPLAYMRGRTLDNSFIILDEAQNTTPAQMKMFLTRIGFGSKVVITGDATQKDLPSGQVSGLDVATRVVKDIEDISICHLTSKDVVRHPLVQRIVKAYEDYESEHENRRGNDAKYKGKDKRRRS